uniref:Uncharacterized protein n=1 Tax=Anguilla anguilla TaxID=7936 RepID=A0A0E9S2X8_ANGAN
MEGQYKAERTSCQVTSCQLSLALRRTTGRTDNTKTVRFDCTHYTVNNLNCR